VRSLNRRLEKLFRQKEKEKREDEEVMLEERESMKFQCKRKIKRLAMGRNNIKQFK